MPRAAGGPVKALALLACIAGPWLVHLAVSRGVLDSVPLALAAPHAAIYSFLLWLFGRTLLRGREPLVTGLARRVHGTLEPEIEIYTRRVTQAWCLFFAAQLAVSALLLAFVPLTVWSLFVNLLNAPLLVLMFTGEYLYRIHRYPDHPRVSIAGALRAFENRADA